MRLFLFVAPVFLGFLAAGCVSNPLDRRFAAGQYSEVVHIFEADSSLHVQERALYRASLAYGLPESPAFNPKRALENLERLLTLFPNSSSRGHALHLRQLLREIHSLTQRQERRDEEVEVLTIRAEEQQKKIAELEETLSKEKTRADALRTIADRLDREARARDAQVQALQEELAGLKEIDLNRPSPEGAAPTRSAAPRPR